MSIRARVYPKAGNQAVAGVRVYLVSEADYLSRFNNNFSPPEESAIRSLDGVQQAISSPAVFEQVNRLDIYFLVLYKAGFRPVLHKKVMPDQASIRIEISLEESHS